MSDKIDSNMSLSEATHARKIEEKFILSCRAFLKCWGRYRYDNVEEKNRRRRRRRRWWWWWWWYKANYRRRVNTTCIPAEVCAEAEGLKTVRCSRGRRRRNDRSGRSSV